MAGLLKSIAALLAGVPIRLPELLIRQLTRVFGCLPGFPLTVSRIDALTGYCRYSSKKINEELGFEFGSTLKERFQSFAQQK